MVVTVHSIIVFLFMLHDYVMESWAVIVLYEEVCEEEFVLVFIVLGAGVLRGDLRLFRARRRHGELGCRCVLRGGLRDARSICAGCVRRGDHGELGLYHAGCEFRLRVRRPLTEGGC